MTNEEILAELEKIRESGWPEGSDLVGVGMLLSMNLSLLVEIRCLLKGFVEARRLGNWPGIAFEGSEKKRGY